jgi:hypothetical protein
MENDWLRLLTVFCRCVLQALAQHLLGVWMAFAAACPDTQLVAQLWHGGRSRRYRMADRTIGDVLANTHNHGNPYCWTLKKPGAPYQPKRAPATSRVKRSRRSG